MAEIIRSIRGMNDILPDVTPYWQAVEHILKTVLSGYGYQEIRFPIVEKTELFKRSINGQITYTQAGQHVSFLPHSSFARRIE